MKSKETIKVGVYVINKFKSYRGELHFFRGVWEKFIYVFVAYVQCLYVVCVCVCVYVYPMCTYSQRSRRVIVGLFLCYPPPYSLETGLFNEPGGCHCFDQQSAKHSNPPCSPCYTGELLTCCVGSGGLNYVLYLCNLCLPVCAASTHPPRRQLVRPRVKL